MDNYITQFKKYITLSKRIKKVEAILHDIEICQLQQNSVEREMKPTEQLLV